ncbi:putative Ribonuclease hii [Leptomonas pyrrhocoris]|uniref:Ribonuclease n=1 Tax=Leptomonas pyrrhocoris TaxID=157538 RepID=A0A0M9FUW4_LEPPY|nr:putative Ribonuclease hii [Leptomonas pyrrhocoris]KPA76575.1 putative Ribonuclease hii [Leptomonas pyrrhocoris]|eukprot:XP_015655014.1 putative Ribonuclease hii [Leptomonas pyrrhocoris]
MAGPVGVAASLYRISVSPVQYTVRDSKKMVAAAREEALDVMCEELGREGSSDFLAQVMADGTCCWARYQRTQSLQAVAARLVDVAVINERNVLNATLEGMAAVCNTIVQTYNRTAPHPITPLNCAILIDGNRTPWTFLLEEQRQVITKKAVRKEDFRKRIGVMHAALEGFRCTTVVKGDDTLLSIAAASIVAKVSRDTYAVHVMHRLHSHYGFDRHKGYCTAEHTREVVLRGPCPFHRLDYAPVKRARDA